MVSFIYSYRIKFDEEKWKSIKEKSNKELKSITDELEKFKNKLLLNKYVENLVDVNFFKYIKIDSIFEYVSINR